MRWSRIVVVVAAFAVALPVGYALARSGGNEATPAAYEKSLETGLPLEPGPTVPEDGSEVDYAIEGPMGAEVVADCKRDPLEVGSGDPKVCEMIIAVENGELPPGKYSEGELEQELTK